MTQFKKIDWEFFGHLVIGHWSLFEIFLPAVGRGFGYRNFNS